MVIVRYLQVVRPRFVSGGFGYDTVQRLLLLGCRNDVVDGTGHCSRLVLSSFGATCYESACAQLLVIAQLVSVKLEF